METIQTENVQVHIFNKAKLGNTESGDTYFVHSEKEYFIFAIADGLGSGPIARQSAEVIPAVLDKHHHEPLSEIIHRCNQSMTRKRGAAVAIVKIHYKKQTVEYNSVGNVRFYILKSKGEMIYPPPVMGYLSGRPQKLKPVEYRYQSGDLFFLHSDGVTPRNPKSLLKESSCPYELYKKAIESVEQRDDATFIAGSLL